MNTASCAARPVSAEAEAPRIQRLSPGQWSALALARRDIAVDGWLREAFIVDLRATGVDRFLLTAIFVRASGLFDQRTWSLTPEDVRAALPDIA